MNDPVVLDIPILTSSLLSQYSDVRFGFSTRRGGVSPEPMGMNLSLYVGDDEKNVHENRRLFFRKVGIPQDRLAVPRQCHSSNVTCVQSPGTFAESDGLVTDQANVYVAVSVADCVPIFLFDRRRKVVAAIHAGWRGTSAEITSNAVDMMKAQFQSSADDIVAFIGPSAGACCYEVDADVAARFAPRSVDHRNGKPKVDLKGANRHQLLESGLPAENIEVSSLCTICSDDMLHSYRRDKERSGRMMGVIGIQKEG